MEKQGKTTILDETEKIFTTDDMAEMPANELMSLLAGVMGRRGEGYDKILAGIANQDIQKHLDAIENRDVRCPKCGGKVLRKNGKRNNIQRYKCLTASGDGEPCGYEFGELSGTILEKTRFTWDAWVEVVYQLINWNSIATTQQILADDYHYPNADEKSIWLMRLKVMYALASIESPVLSGTVQVDDTFLRDNQKGSRELYNPLPESFNVPRVARTGKNRRVNSECGAQGNEYAAITCAIDRSGRAVVRTLGSGALGYEAFCSFMDEHTDGISFLCSDAAGPIAKYCDIRNIPHYVYPSNYRDLRKKMGYAERPENETKAERRKRDKHNRGIVEPMWRNGTGPHIDNYPGVNTIDKFWCLCDEQKLTINGVNSLHAALKRRFNKYLHSVSTKYLPYYLALFEFLWNRGVIEDDEGETTRKKIVSHKEAELILLAAIETRVNFTAKDIDEIRSNPPALSTVSKKKMGEIHKTVQAARESLGEKNFTFPDDAGIEIGRIREYLAHLSKPRLITLCEMVDLRQWKKQRNNKTMLVERLAKHKQIREAIAAEQIAYAKADVKDRVNEIAENKLAKHTNIRTTKDTVPKSNFITCWEAIKDICGKVVFLDVETTGTDYKRDEVLSVAMVSLDGAVLFDETMKPRHTARWSDAEAINGISPADVADRPTIEVFVDEIEDLIRDADYICGWNVGFDLRMLIAAGVNIPNTRYGSNIDLMDDYKKWWLGSYKRKRKPSFSLNATARRHGFSYDAHTSLGDAAVLIPIWHLITGTEGDGTGVLTSG